MIILSQDRETLYNFENMRLVEIIEENDCKGACLYSIKSRYGDELGVYKTREKAMHVLVQLAEFAKTTPVFYMPEE